MLRARDHKKGQHTREREENGHDTRIRLRRMCTFATLQFHGTLSHEKFRVDDTNDLRLIMTPSPTSHKSHEQKFLRLPRPQMRQISFLGIFLFDLSLKGPSLRNLIWNDPSLTLSLPLNNVSKTGPDVEIKFDFITIQWNLSRKFNWSTNPEKLCIQKVNMFSRELNFPSGCQFLERKKFYAIKKKSFKSISISLRPFLASSQSLMEMKKGWQEMRTAFGNLRDKNENNKHPPKQERKNIFNHVKEVDFHQNSKVASLFDVAHSMKSPQAIQYIYG
jgi:hypothetical protein